MAHKDQKDTKPGSRGIIVSTLVFLGALVFMVQFGNPLRYLLPGNDQPTYSVSAELPAAMGTIGVAYWQDGRLAVSAPSGGGRTDPGQIRLQFSQGALNIYAVDGGLTFRFRTLSRRAAPMASSDWGEHLYDAVPQEAAYLGTIRFLPYCNAQAAARAADAAAEGILLPGYEVRPVFLSGADFPEVGGVVFSKHDADLCKPGEVRTLELPHDAVSPRQAVQHRTSVPQDPQSEGSKTYEFVCPEV